MKKLLTLTGSVALFVATIFPAFAANNCSNGTTGPGALNYCTINNTSSVSVSNVNNANITNNVTAVSRSGGNSASYNTMGGNITTGNSTLNATVSNVANVNTTTVTGGPAASGNTGTNDVTGPISQNIIDIRNAQSVAVANVNNADTDNTLNTTSDSGDNAANYNTGPAAVQTGSARVGLTLTNHLNDSATAVSAGAGGTGGNTGYNGTTGPSSLDYVTINNTTSASVVNPNNLDLDNTVDALSRSGANGASYNTLGATIGTGGASSSLGVSNEGNINTTTVQMSMGGFANNCGSEVTGPLSDNRCELFNSMGISVTNPNNSDIDNYDNDQAISGDNVANYNTGEGRVTAGLSDLIKSILTHVNDSFTAITQ